MKILIFAVGLLLPSTSFAADALNINARDHDCAAIGKIIRDNKKVFVRTGFGGRSFRYPPARCNLGDMYTTVTVRDAKGQQCVLKYACINDPSSFYNFSFDR
ncbi:hypothetical protein QO002_002376 [Pararhizobium capsulatum DSM 1112]|uniref:Uncharacterized protein n=1 Tax=Pararhizobium capsulatum DSM 1112 TaxID=1121113 RepID=A0ABU0BPS2_9HYPH|nr:hypothetical protein [Pararhizobium capsulatum]MDQ0320238.1 hypothetical protein [Pararhizobium capsulatum DSM 1112]